MNFECKLCGSKDTEKTVLNVGFGDLGKSQIYVWLCLKHRDEYVKKEIVSMPMEVAQ